MRSLSEPSVAVVDYGLGNLYSVLRACERAQLSAQITSDPATLARSDAVLLPGVGAFGDAMDNLRRLNLVEPLRNYALSGRPLVGICLGLQLLMSESEEFGRHRGLGIIPGRVLRFCSPQGPQGTLKVPQVGWNRILRPQASGAGDKPADRDPWKYTPLESLPGEPYMYFVHSYYVVPEDPQVVLSWTSYGDVTFCSSLRWNNVTAFQFHPERSGNEGARIYANIARQIRQTRESHEESHVAA